MKITREELQAIENHISNIPHVGGMYAPVLIAWCRALLDEQDAAYRRGAEAMREACARWMSEREGISQWVYDDALSTLPIPGEP
jgi:hypothetical protein